MKWNVMFVYKDSIIDLIFFDLFDLGGIIFLFGVYCFDKNVYKSFIYIFCIFFDFKWKMVCIIKRRMAIFF